jgi:adenylate kinase
MKVIILLGAPGSGKGTQAKLLQKKFGLKYIGSGEMLRERQKVKDFTGKKLLMVSWKKGELVPTFLISKLWIDELEKLKSNPKFKGFILDGSPRKIIETLLLDEALKWYEWQKNVKFFLINISKKESIWRLTKRRTCQDCGRIIPYPGGLKKLKKCDQCGGKLMIRKDQSPRAIKKRLEEFEKETKPVINYYRKQGRLIEINGEQSIESIFKDILKVI